MKRRFSRANREGVSSVVSAVLVFGLLTIMLSVYLANIVPDRIAQTEAQHSRLIVNRMAELSDQIGRATVLADRTQFSLEVPLGTETPSLFGPHRSFGSLSGLSADFGSTFTCSAAELLARDGVAAPGATGDAMTGAGASVLTFERLAAAEIKITTYAAVGPQQVRWSLTQGASQVGAFVLQVEESGTNKVVRALTYDDFVGGDLLVEQLVVPGAASISSLVVNVLDPIYGFSALLRDTTGAKTLTLASDAALQAGSPPDAAGYVVYVKAGGFIDTFGTGRNLPDGFTRSAASDALVFTPRYSEFVNQDVLFQGGASVLSQDNGEYVHDPPFSLLASGADQLLNVRLLDVTVSGTSSGSQRAVVTTTVDRPTSSVLRASDCTWDIITGTERAWFHAFQNAFRTANLPTTGIEPPPAIALRAVSSATTLAGDAALTLGLPVPVGTAAGDVLVAQVGFSGGTAVTVTPPAGWALVRRDDHAANLGLALYSRIAVASETATYPAGYGFGFSTPQKGAGGVIGYSGGDPVSPVDVHGGISNLALAQIRAPSVTTTVADARLIGFFGTAEVTTMTPPGGMTERFDRTTTAVSSVSVSAADMASPTPGATGDKIATTLVSALNVGQLVAIQPHQNAALTVTFQNSWIIEVAETTVDVRVS